MASLYNNKFYHRDLSWLRFNHRVLQEAADTRNPLYERIKFLAIFSSNLDEFFKVRVSDIRQIRGIEKPLRKKLISKPNKVLLEIQKQVHLQQEEFGKIFNNEIIPQLKKEGIHLISYQEFSPQQKEAAQNYYLDTLRHKSKVHQNHINEDKVVFIENEQLYLAGLTSPEILTIVEIPADESRFFQFPEENGKHYITFVDDILKHALIDEYGKDAAFFSIKSSKDAELYIENELSGNLAERIRNSLSKRKTGETTRLLLDQNAPQTLQTALEKALDVSSADMSVGGTYHNFRDFFSFPNPTNKKLSHDDLPPLPHPVLSNTTSIFSEIETKDQLVHYPYQSFQSLIDWMEEASVDPSVKTIKLTIYRAAKESRLNQAILKAIENGIEVTVFIEVKARFDEQNNLKWGDLFKEKGANVIYSYPDIKVHSKILYMERVVDEKLRSYAYISTGNFNESTAKIYTDFGLYTANKKITKEINKVFLVLERKILVPKTKRLLVSPFTTRSEFIRLIEEEINFAKEGKEAKITLKMNSLQDKDMIKMLYRANNAGVKIRLLIRGICCIVPGIEGQSEHIYVTSIIDRFLEHGRAFIFGNDGDPKVFIGSADWMTRNLSHRIEVITPVLDPDLKQTIIDLVDIQLKDNVKARIVDAEQTNRYVENQLPKVQSQLETHRYFQ